MKTGRTKITAETEAQYLADVALAANFPTLLTRAQAAEHEYRRAQALAKPFSEQYPLARQLDEALTDATRAAYAAERAEIGPQGYADRIYRRKAKATTKVRAWTAEAERLLTLREAHRLTGFPPRPAAEAIGAEVARMPEDTYI